MVYPTLLAAVGDVAAPRSRGSAVGAYRFWRDLGYPVGALLVGALADFFGMKWSIGGGRLGHLRIGASRRRADARDAASR
jgi:hypothetical protein